MCLVSFRHFCTSPELLRLYRSDCDVWKKGHLDTKELKKAIEQSLRSENPSFPDHQHQQRVKYAFEEAHSLSDMLLYALGAVSTEQERVHGLSLRQERICVNAPAFEDWQREVASYQSPVPLLAAFRLNEALRQGLTGREIAGYGLTISPVEQRLKEDLRATCLPSMHDPRLDDLIQEKHPTLSCQGGRLVDTHMHINGSTEATVAWLHALVYPARFCREIQKATKKNDKARYFLCQLHTSEGEIFSALCRAANVRLFLWRLLWRWQGLASGKTASPGTKTDPLSWAKIAAILRHSQQFPLFGKNLWQRYGWTDLQTEGLFWLRALVTLMQTKCPELAALLHYYLLLMHQFFRLLVQHPDQNGFDQFQYITLDGAREAVESETTQSFKQRFVQFCGMYGAELALLEARFSPKKSIESNVRLLKHLWEGYKEAMREECRASRPVYDIALIAHFIKEQERQPYIDRRYHALRDSYMHKAKVLIATQRRLRISDPELAQRLVAKDAASNELETPPEVFAPVFRYLKRHGISATTYHAGEDFRHVLCGMRAVYEAFYFLEMGSGDRIGHATAIGIDPDCCCETSGTDIFCQQGEWLDSLVWLTWMLHRHPKLADLRQQVPSFVPDIEKLYRKIYQKDCPELPVLWDAWRLRTLDPQILDKKIIISSDTRSEVLLLKRLQESMGKHRYEKAEKESMEKEHRYKKAEKEFRSYHEKKYRGAYENIIGISSHQQPPVEMLRAVQDAIIQDLRDNRVAVEVLPTSNVRISHYKETKQHHLLRWMDSSNERPAPFIVLGTDDPGIFATTIRNEVALVLRRLNRMYPSRSEVPYEIIENLIRNGRSYAFSLANA